MKKWIRRGIIIAGWLVIWQLLAFKLDNRILLTGPIEVLRTLYADIQTAVFWRTCLNSLGHILAGFGLAFFMAAVLGILSGFCGLLEEILSPVIQFMKAVPVASIVVLVLIWTGSKNLAVIVVFLMVFPIIYFGFLSGIKNVDPKKLEMTEVFRFTWINRMIYLYRPALMPFVLAACKSALGMSWKAGVAAEVIGVPDHSIGERIYLSKIYLDTAELFAWTLVVILLSVLFEHLVLLLLQKIADARCKLFSVRNQNLVQSGLIQEKDKRSKKENEVTPFTISNLSKAFGEKIIWQHVTYTFEPSNCYCIVGESGSGKTTLFRMLWSGAAGAESRKQKISVVFQEERLLEEESAVVNVLTAMRKGYSCDRVVSALQTLLPEEALWQPVKELSGGMRRRVSICRAMLADSTCVILDEPFNGLDEENKARTAAWMQAEAGDRILIMATHNREEADLLGAQIVELDRMQA